MKKRPYDIWNSFGIFGAFLKWAAIIIVGVSLIVGLLKTFKVI